MFVIAVQAEKGGVGKTTTAVSLAYILAEEHKARVLLIDACWWPQERAKSMRRYTSGLRVKRAWGRFQRSFHAVS